MPKKEEEIDISDLIDRFDKHMGKSQFFTAADLVKMRIYGCKSSVWRAVHNGDIEAIQISDRRWVILKDSLINHLKKRTK